MASKELQSKCALITGASSGLGVDFARELAQRGARLILVARRKDRLEQVAQDLRTQHGVEVDVLLLPPDDGEVLLEGGVHQLEV